MYILFAFLTGISIVINTIINGKLAQREGMVNGVIINYLMGTIASIIVCFVMRNSIPSLSSIGYVPIHYFLGGFVGVSIIYLFNTIVPQIPAVYVVILPFIGQILTSAIIDYIYLDIFSKGKIIGGILFLIGLVYNARIDKKYKKENEPVLEVKA
ncbi:DMT family transporter [Tepidibacter aestuarii]|uniref:DMT family transporter n=1 Tax=Tepidibacter aestuarii TaxID=2925782 RepID=UPI0020BD7027|nr:DMT family transporter [Tepidibacter aestuarii]CAH2213094.1 bacterial/archaeal transporter family-2 protein [Tepidibacter aestuarii]